MKTITVGMSGLQVRTILNNIGKVYNVKDYGALCDGNTDDTVAINAAIYACYLAGGGIVFFPVGIYVVSGAVIGLVDGVTYNSQITIPYLAGSSTIRRTIHLIGEVCPNMHQSTGIIYGYTDVTPSTGVIIKSTIAGNAANQFIIGAGFINGGDQWITGNANQIIIENIQVQPVVNGSNAITIGGINMRGVLNATIKNTCVYPFNFNVQSLGEPINNCIGIVMPKYSCGIHNVLDNVSVGGFETGFTLGEHTAITNLTAVACKYGYDSTTNFQMTYGARIGAYWCANSIKFSGVSWIDIHQLQVEWAQHGKWFDNAYTILDASNYAHGEIHYSITEHDVGINNSKFNKSGGANLQCLPIGFAAAASFTVTGADDLAGIAAALKAKGLITY